MTADEEGSVRRIAFEYFTDHPHLWVLAMQRIRQIADECSWHVLNGVLPDTIDARNADPPERILNLVARDLEFFLIHVRQIIVEPAIECVPHFSGRRVRRQ